MKLTIKLFLALILCAVVTAPVARAQQDQAIKPKQGTYAITNVRIETVSNGTIENGTIVVKGDRIEAVSR